MRLAQLAVALAIPAAPLACVSELSGTVERRCPASPAALHEERTGLTYASCGALEPAADCFVSAEQAAAFDCFAAALATCSPARLDVRISNDEGGIVENFDFVEPDGQGGCRVAVLIDDRADPFAREPGVFEQLCDDPVLGDACSVVAGGTCSEPMRLCVAGTR
jgi:hypothetical protein